MRNRLRFWLDCHFTTCVMCHRHILSPYWKWLGAIAIYDGCVVHERCYADELWTAIR